MKINRKKIAQCFNQFVYVAGVVVLIPLTYKLLTEKDIFNVMSISLLCFSIMGISVIEYKSFINKGLPLEEVYHVSQHKKIRSVVNLFVIAGLSGATALLWRNPMAVIEINGYQVQSEFFVNIMCVLLGASIVLAILNFILGLVNKGLDRYLEKNKKLEEDCHE